VPRNKAKKSGIPEWARFESLEPRVLYSADAAPFAVLLESNANQLDSESDNSATFALAHFADTRSDDHQSILTDTSNEGSLAQNFVHTGGIREIVLVVDGDSTIESLVSELRSELDASIAIEVLDTTAGDNILASFANTLSQYENLDAIHIISHASDGELRFGSQTIDTKTLTQNEAALKRIGESLNADGDILLYGCNLSAGESGHVFAQTLSSLTSADVASSNNLTGHGSLAGDWDLEVVEGVVETRTVTSPRIQSDWSATLDINMGLVHHWLLDGDGVDSIGGATALINDLLFYGGLVGTAADFSPDSTGSTSSAVINSSLAVAYNQADFSYAFWMRGNTFGSPSTLISNFGADGYGFEIGIDAQGYAIFTVTDAVNSFSVTSTTQIDTGDWFHLTAERGNNGLEMSAIVTH